MIEQFPGPLFPKTPALNTLADTLPRFIGMIIFLSFLLSSFASYGERTQRGVTPSQTQNSSDNSEAARDNKDPKGPRGDISEMPKQRSENQKNNSDTPENSSIVPPTVVPLPASDTPVKTGLSSHQKLKALLVAPSVDGVAIGAAGGIALGGALLGSKAARGKRRMVDYGKEIGASQKRKSFDYERFKKILEKTRPISGKTEELKRKSVEEKNKLEKAEETFKHPQNAHEGNAEHFIK